MKLIRDFDKTPDSNSIILICVVRDEELLLPAFLNHYEKLGISHFIFIDNGSEDNTLLHLSSNKTSSIQIWQTEESYADNDYGVAWVNQLLTSQCKEKWCVVVDADEFIVLNKQQLLTDLKTQLESKNQNIAQFVLVDFYAKENTSGKLQYEQNLDPFIASNYYDTFQNVDYYFQGIAPDRSTILKGGMRQRVFSQKPAHNDSVCLNKKSFFKYTFYNSHLLSAGMHWLFPADFEDWNYNNWNTANKHLSYSSTIHIIAHFKFIKPNLYDYIQLRIDRNQDWNNSEEYKTYLKYKKDTFYDTNISRKFSTIEQLYDDTIYNLLKNSSP